MRMIHIIWFVANFANARGWGTGCKLTGRPSWDRQGLKFCGYSVPALPLGQTLAGLVSHHMPALMSYARSSKQQCQQSAKHHAAEKQRPF